MGTVAYLQASTDHFLSEMAGTIERECMRYGYAPIRLQKGRLVSLVLPGLHARTRYTMSPLLSETSQKLVLKTTLMVPFSGVPRWNEEERVSGISRGVVLRICRYRLVLEVCVPTNMGSLCSDVKKQLDTVSPKALAITEYLFEVGLLRTCDPDLGGSINPIC